MFSDGVIIIIAIIIIIIIVTFIVRDHILIFRTLVEWMIYRVVYEKASQSFFFLNIKFTRLFRSFFSSSKNLR